MLFTCVIVFVFLAVSRYRNHPVDLSGLSHGNVPVSPVQWMWVYTEIRSEHLDVLVTRPQNMPGMLPRHTDHQHLLCVLCLSVDVLAMCVFVLFGANFV